MHFLFTLQYLFLQQCRIWSLLGHGKRHKPSYLPIYTCICSNTKIPHITNLSSWKLLLLYRSWWFEACFLCSSSVEWSKSSRSSSPGNTGTGAPSPALRISAPNARWLPCKGHAFTTWNGPRELLGYHTERFSVLLWSLPCSMKETCCWERSDLELAPLAGADSEETVSWFKCCDFLRHLSSYRPVGCCTQKRFNGAEKNTFCLLSQDSKAWTITKTGNRKPKLRIQPNKLAGL